MIKRYSVLVFGVLLPLLLLSACKTNLYTGLSEQDANEMIAVLIRHNLDSSKSSGDKGTWDIMVEESQLAQAVEVLKSTGYPRDSYKSIGDVFGSSGLVSSPMEERIRFIYALSQELANTLSRIDGVIDARVHIVLPENDPLAQTIEPSSASVFIKHSQESNVDEVIPQIKHLVLNSIEGLTYNNVTVVLFPSEDLAPGPNPTHVSTTPYEVVIVCLAALLLACLGVLVYLLRGKLHLHARKGA